jgi:hypothetical protein
MINFQVISFDRGDAGPKELEVGLPIGTVRLVEGKVYSPLYEHGVV